jgi:hypothetical protein
MTSEPDDNPHVGSASGEASPPVPPGPGADAEEGPGAPGEGDTEIPLGIPVSGDEWNRLKEAARRPDRRGGRDDGNHGAEPQEDVGLDE